MPEGGCRCWSCCSHPGNRVERDSLSDQQDPVHLGLRTLSQSPSSWVCTATIIFVLHVGRFSLFQVPAMCTESILLRAFCWLLCSTPMPASRSGMKLQLLQSQVGEGVPLKMPEPVEFLLPHIDHATCSTLSHPSLNRRALAFWGGGTDSSSSSSGGPLCYSVLSNLPPRDSLQSAPHAHLLGPLEQGSCVLPLTLASSPALIHEGRSVPSPGSFHPVTAS